MGAKRAYPYMEANFFFLSKTNVFQEIYKILSIKSSKNFDNKLSGIVPTPIKNTEFNPSLTCCCRLIKDYLSLIPALANAV